MSIKQTRRDEVLAYISGQPGGETTATNADIAAAIESVNNEYSGTIRVAETLRDLEDSGDITITRTRRHPQLNPSGRTITVTTF